MKMNRPWIRLAATLLLAAPVAAEIVEQGIIGEGTPFATRWYSHDSEVEGPTVLIIGGMHGDEPAGHRAATQVATWSVDRGRIVVVPAANPPALADRTRRIPGLEEDAGDLNRHFPVVDGTVTPTGPAAPALWSFVVSVEPDVVIDLHEGYGFRAAGSKSVGSSIITHRRADDAAQALMLEAVNTGIEDPERQFVPLRSIVARSLARGAAVSLDAEGHIFETTTAKQPLSRRCRQHRTMVATRLVALDMIEDASIVNQLVCPVDARPTIAIYDGGGAGGASQGRRFEAQLPGCRVDRIGPADIQAGGLDQFDAVIFPGGSGSGQAKAIQQSGRDSVRSFVKDGGAYIGVCAGAYLALDNYSWSLQLLALDSIDREHWRRGRAMLRIDLTEPGREVFDTGDSTLDISFRQGPLMRPSAELDGRDEAEVLAWFRTGVGENGADPQVMVDTPAIVRGRFGQGRVLLFSPHPEKTEGLESWLRSALDWTTAAEAPQTPATIPEGG